MRETATTSTKFSSSSLRVVLNSNHLQNLYTLRPPRSFNSSLISIRSQKMDAARSVTEPLHGFMTDSVRLVRRCNKPDRKGMLCYHVVTHSTALAATLSTNTPTSLSVEFLKISQATLIGFAVMGFIGFFVRLIHIPVNSILLGTLIASSAY